MKLTDTVIELMFELSNLEGGRHSEYLSGEGKLLRNNLLKLFSTTDSIESKEIIIDIMSEAGYPWFGNLASTKKPLMQEIIHPEEINDNQIMTDDEFMDLLPANGHIH